MAYKRHECEVTYDRLMGHVIKYNDKLTGQEKDAVAAVMQALFDISEGAR